MSNNKSVKTALVTGAGSGMGEATAKRLARDGMQIGVLDINGESANRVAEEINKAGGKALGLQADISNRDQIESALAKLRKELGAITVLVNNAAVEEFCPFKEIKDENWDKVFQVNVKGMYIVTQAVLPDMENAGWGRIVNVAAYGAQLSAPDMSHYFASKGAVISLTRGLAAELGSKGITVNTVSPGFIDTPMARRAIAESKFPITAEDIYSRYPIPRLGKPEEIAAACAFFASDEASFVTAQLLGVNGGAAV